MQLAGHVQCMHNTQTPKKMFEGKPEGRRPVGKPRKRYASSVDGNSPYLRRFKN